MQVKALSGTTTLMRRRVAYHQVHDLLVLSLDFIKKRRTFPLRLSNAAVAPLVLKMSMGEK